MKSRTNPFFRASCLLFTAAACTNSALSDTTITQGLNNIETTSNPALGVITRDPGGIAWFNTAGTATASGTTLSNGILGPWAFIGTGTDTRYATLSGGDITGLTGTPAANFGWSTGNPTNNNYDVAATTTSLGSSRAANTVRYTGGAASQALNSSTTLTLNGLINAGSGTLTLSGGSSTGGVVIGSTQELVLNSAAAGITISAPIRNNGAGASALTITGPNGVILSGTNTYTGATTIASGSLTSSSLGALGSGAIHISSSASLITNATQTISQTVTGAGAITSDAGTLTLSGDFSGFSGTFTHNTPSSSVIGSIAALSANASYNVAADKNSGGGGIVLNILNGTNTLEMGALSGVADSLIRNGLSVSGTNTLRVGNLNTDTEFAGTLGGGGGTLALEKVGNGTLTLSGTNTYTGITTVTTGTLALSGSGSIANSLEIAVASGATLDVSAVTGGNWTVGATQSLTGSGGVTGATTIAGTHNAGDSAVGTQAFSGNLSYAAGSIFEWDLTSSSTSSGFDKVTSGGTIDVSTTDTIFKVILGGDALTDIQNINNAFWNTPNGTQSWTMADIFGQAFGSGAFQSVETSTDVSSYGSFSISGTTLTWTAVPEPSASVLTGLLLTAGLLRRRRA